MVMTSDKINVTGTINGPFIMIQYKKKNNMS